MQCRLSKRFTKAVSKLPRPIQLQVIEVIEAIQTTETLTEIRHIKPLSGYEGFYRIKIGTYRMGLFLNNGIVEIEKIGARGDFYKGYPPK